jgi:hypothetical protein
MTIMQTASETSLISWSDDGVLEMTLEVASLFSVIFISLPVALGHGVLSASNRNEYKKQKNNVSEE